MIALAYLATIWFAASVIFAVIAGRTIHLRDRNESIRAAAPEWETAR